MKKDFLELVADNSETKLFKVLSRREDLLIRIDSDLVSKLENDAKLKKMLRTLLRRRAKYNRREVIDINRHNYRIFL